MKTFFIAALAVISAVVLRDKLPVEHVTNMFHSLNLFSPPTVRINIFKNGWETENITHQLFLNSSRTIYDVQKEIAALLYPNAEVTQVAVYNDHGDLLSDPQQFKNDMDLYVSINGDLFMHPGKYVGWKRTVAGMTIVTLSLAPRVFLVENLLSSDQCDAITKEVSDNNAIHRSVVYQENGEDVSTTRTSSTAYVNYPEHLLEKAFNLTKLPDDRTYLYPDYQLQVIHYEANQYFHPHHDGFFIESVGTEEKWFELGKRNRYLTLFLYLNDVEEGGETAFIEYEEYVKFYQQADKYDVHTNNPCDKARVSKTPSKGDAILFYNLKPGGSKDGEIDWTAVHSGCGVKKGVKWACNVWMYNKPTAEPEYLSIMERINLIKPVVPTTARPAGTEETAAKQEGTAAN